MVAGAHMHRAWRMRQPCVLASSCMHTELAFCTGASTAAAIAAPAVGSACPVGALAEIWLIYGREAHCTWGAGAAGEGFGRLLLKFPVANTLRVNGRQICYYIFALGSDRETEA